jgi:hypothetical protein
MTYPETAPLGWPFTTSEFWAGTIHDEISLVDRISTLRYIHAHIDHLRATGREDLVPRSDVDNPMREAHRQARASLGLLFGDVDE